MKRQSLIIAGIVLIFMSAMIGLVILPSQLVEKDTYKDADFVPLSVREGHAIYVREGCVYCHSQQARPEGFGADAERGWGRASVPDDYKGLSPHVMGTMRTGPDLANIGARQPSRDWHLTHLFQPRAVSPGSNMAPFPWLFEIVDKSARPNQDGIRLPDEYAIEGKKVIPTKEADKLVDYLLYLNQKEN